MQMVAKQLMGTILFLALMAAIVTAADYQCVYKNQGQVNCNAYNAGNTFCYAAGPGAVANNPATAVTCTNNAPGKTGTIICQLSNYSGPENSLRCSNSTYLLSGPTKVSGGASDSCSYNDCELNQLSCASGYAYQQCVPDPNSTGCNKWQATNCVANAPCYSTTTAQLAQCIGIPATEITSQGGVYFRTQTSGSTGSSGSTGTGSGNSGTSSGSTGTTATGVALNGKTYYLVRSDNPAGDTGNEVCQAMGKTCVGYTATDVSVCSKFYPNAKVVSNSVNGSKSPYFCDGPPQKELACEATYNTCAICPQCNVNVDCSTQIGTQFRGMFVECTGGSSGGSIQGLLQNLGIIGDGVVNVIDEGTNPAGHYTATVKGGTVVSAGIGDGANPKYNVKITASASLAIKSSSDPYKEAIKQYKNGGIIVTTNDIIANIQLFFFKLII